MGRTARVLTAAALLCAVGCAGSDTNDSETNDSNASNVSREVSGEVVVFAAASLTDVFDQIASAFEAAHPLADVTLSFGGSSSLAVSVEEGAPADVLATANTELMQRLVDDGLTAGSASVFATNSLTVAVPVGSDLVTSLEDFARDDLFLGACDSQVPCGAYADELFARAGVSPAFDTRTADVRSLVALLIVGELDAGVVYATDVAASPELSAIDTGADGPTADYPIAVLAAAPHPDAASEFIEFVLGSAGQGILDEAGFGAP